MAETFVSPQPGDFAVCRIRGPVGLLIRLGQWLNGNGFRDYEHSFVCVSNATGTPQIVEAQPWGAQYASASRYSSVKWSTGLIPLTDDQRDKIVTAADGFANRHVPYGFLTYVALAAHRFHLPIPGLRRIISSTKAMICSQLVAKCYQAAGIDLFPDLWDGYVTPAMLANLLASKR